MKFFLLIAKVLLSIFILLFAIATMIGGAYMQTIILVLMVALLFFWPLFPGNSKHSKTSRIIAFAMLFILLIILISNTSKSSIYRSEKSQTALKQKYDSLVEKWPSETQSTYLLTEYGTVHVLSLGNSYKPPILLLHAASMAAFSMEENIRFLQNNFYIHAIDHIGEGNQSQLTDAMVYPKTERQLADLYASIADKMGIESCPVVGASNGGFIAQAYAHYYPEKVESLVLLGPMGLSPLSAGSKFMMSLPAMYPIQLISDRVARWALGDDPYCHEKYGDWFDAAMKGTFPSVMRPVPMTEEQKKSMDLPILLFLGSDDPIVGDTATAMRLAEDYPNIQIEVLESGHLIGVEQREFVNKRMAEFLQ